MTSGRTRLVGLIAVEVFDERDDIMSESLGDDLNIIAEKQRATTMRSPSVPNAEL